MKRIISALGVILMSVVGASGVQAQANIAGEWTYGDGGGKATIQQVGSDVSYQGVWLFSNDKYELKGHVREGPPATS